MSEVKRIINRNAEIAAMLSDGERLRNFYRFAAQNPHIELYDACQIIIARPNASVCFSFEEWNGMGRRIIKGKKGIPYYDREGNKGYLFDSNDTYGVERFQRTIYPMKRLLIGLDELNGTKLADDWRSDYRKLHKGVATYMRENGRISDDEVYSGLLIEGIAYSLYCRTGFPKDSIEIHGFPYDYRSNAEFFKTIYTVTAELEQEIEDAYKRKEQAVEIIDDTEENTVSDEPILLSEKAKEKKIVTVHSAIISNYKGYDILLQWKDDKKAEVYIGKRGNYDNKGNYDNTDGSLTLVSTNEKMFNLLSHSEWVLSQQEMVDRGFFTEQDYKELYDLENGILKGIEKTDEIKFGVDINKGGSGTPFRYPNWQDEKVSEEKSVKQEKKQRIIPTYQKYLEVQKQYPNAVILQRLGDFYEVMGDYAVKVAEELDLILTGRDVGLAERVPMIGVPYHAIDKYFEKMLERHSVVILDGDEPKYVLSNAEARGEMPISQNVFEDNGVIYDNNDEEQPDYVGDIDTRFPIDDYYDEDWDDYEEEQEDYDEEWQEVEETDETEQEPIKKERTKSSTKQRIGKRIQDRKSKEMPQLSFFDILEPQEQSEQEALIERQLKYGSLGEYGKFHILDKYQENPTEKEFTDFLKNEYGIGGHGAWGGDEENHDGKGITMSVRGDEGEYLVQVNLKWSEVAERIADLIYDDNYLSDDEKRLYEQYKIEQTKAQKEKEQVEKERTAFINKVISGTNQERKERILDEYSKMTDRKVFEEFLANEYGTSTEGSEDYRVKYDPAAAWITKYDTRGNTEERYVLTWKEFADRVGALIEESKYFKEELRDEDNGKIQQIVDAIIKEGTANSTEGNWITYFEEFNEDEQFVREHRSEIVEALKSREEVSDVFIDDDAFDTNYYLNYCPNYEWKDEEKDEEHNTDLNKIGFNQSELGGAKTRFKNNVAAIKIVNRLYAENRNPTAEEKKILAQFVGWGGLPQVFDEHNGEWRKEYAELKGLLSDEDYERAKGSTLNAHYTSQEVIDGIYKALDHFGVKGNNRILEPAMGTGNFFGFMPQDIADGSKLYGVELDNLTGRIAAKLYPQASVQIKGFEDTSFPNDKFDIVVGNVPFGGYGVFDSAYNKYNFLIHDFFLAKSVDKLKAGGMMAVVTSKGTLDKQSQNARKYLADRAELIGAIRLPYTAFKQTAGTEVISDILFFRKREEKIDANSENTEWLTTGKTEEGYEINQYFLDHPEMVLGTFAKEHGLYGAEDITVIPDDRPITVALSDAIAKLPSEIFKAPEIAPEAEQAIDVDYNIKPLCYKADSGRLYMRIGEKMVEEPIPKHPKDAYQRIKEMIALREELHHILDIQIQGCSDEVLKREQWKLNSMYEIFVKRYGNINSSTNTRLFKDDGDSALLFACEDIDEETKAISKADIFSKRTIRPYTMATNTSDCFEALQISKNERGKVDIQYIEELTKKDYDTVITELGDSVFRDPELIIEDDKYSGFVSAEEYLSGFVKDKLSVAKSYTAEHPEFQKNIDALGKVQPMNLTASDISVRLGASWIDKKYYEQYYRELIGLHWYYKDDFELFYNPHDSSWRLDQKAHVRYSTEMKQKEVYGTKRAPAYRLFEDCLNLRATTIYDLIHEDGKNRRVVNQAETIAAREKQNKIKEEFKNWIFANPERRDELEATYNALFNRIRLPSYDGDYLKFPEMNPSVELKPHQKDAVHRIITSKGSTLLHHVVGAGKTYTMIASIMKMRQYGLCNKAMVVVPNHLVGQWAVEWRKLYPNAKILIATKEDLEKDNRQRFVSKCAMGDWDGIIIAQSSFAKIPISAKRQIRKLREEIQSIDETARRQWEESGMPRGAIKNLERIKKSKEALLKKLMDDSKKDSVLLFENLGVDYLFIDEAHYYKNLFLFSKMNNVAGISNAASQRASDLKLKIEYLQELHGSDRGVVFATGTPISNSMTEMYTMQNYLQPSVLRESGITYFDGWAADFGETVTSLELAPSGQGYKARTRFSKFTNLPELLTMYRSFADVQTADMVKLEVPEAERIVVNLKPSETVIELAEEIAERANEISSGSVDPHYDNMLKVTSDGKKLALDPRCYVDTAEDKEGSKLNECVIRIHEIWEQTAQKKGTQLVFCDLSTPKKRFEAYEYRKDFDIYNDLKYKLVQQGIPSDEIAFIHDASTDEQKQALFDKVNSGAIRVLIGSTEKCGAGTNVQKRLVALHHLDTPYRPSDMQQREGRIIRQGNTNDKVQIFTYVTERTFDSYSYQILENKQRFISQIDRGDLTVREAEDIDDRTLTYAEIKAITAANPKIKRKMEVDTEVARLRVLEGQYRKNLYTLQDKIRKTFPEDIRRQEILIERIKEDTVMLKENYNPEVFSISVNGKVYTDKKEGGNALMEAINASKPDKVIAEYCGFKISVDPIVFLSTERTITLAGSGRYSISIGQSASGNLTRLDNFATDFSDREKRMVQRLNQLRQDMAIAEEEVKKPFEHEDELLTLLSEQAQLNEELNLDKKEEIIIEEGDEEVSTDETNYTALPTQKERTPKGRPRKRINASTTDAYKMQKAKMPDAYIFCKNGDGYDLVGEQAVEFAAIHGLSVKTEEVDGEEFSVVSIKADELDKYVGELAGDGKKTAIIEPNPQPKILDFIEDEDKAAAMAVEIFPDHSVAQENMHEYGYTWDGMLPLRKSTANVLYSIVPIAMLNRNDTENDVTSEDDIKIHTGLFGVEKSVWNDFVESKEGIAYLFAKKVIADAVANVLNKDMDYIDARFVDPLSDMNFEERGELNRYLKVKPTPTIEEMKPYIKSLFDMQARSFGGIPYEAYGWNFTDIEKTISNHIADEEIRKYIRQVIEESIEQEEKMQDEKGKKESLKEFLDKGLSEIMWLEGRRDDFSKEEISDISNDLKSYFEGSPFDGSNEDYPYDEWYDDFVEDRLQPLLMESYVAKDKKLNEDQSERDKERYEQVIRQDFPKDFADEDPFTATLLDEAEKNAEEKPLFEGDFEETTKQGFSIKAMFFDGSRYHAIVCRDIDGFHNDYFVARGYDKKTGQWAQGEYDFSEYDLAEQYVYEEFPNVRKIEMANKDNVTDYFKEKVIESVNKEFDNFKSDLLNKTTEEVFYSNFKIHVYTEMCDVIAEEDFLSDKDYRALYEDRGHILHELYDDYIGDEYASINTYGDTAEYIKNYCEEYQPNIMSQSVWQEDKPYYFGKENGVGYYYLPTLNRDNLSFIKTESSEYVVIAPTMSLNQDTLKKYKITFLKLGRDIAEEELKNDIIAINNINAAMQMNSNKLPIYLQTAEYALQHNEDEKFYYSHWVSEDCKNEITQGIQDNYSDNHLNTGFLDPIIEKYGIERVAYICATTIREAEWDGRYSKANREWANTIPISEEQRERYNVSLTNHPALVDGMIKTLRQKFEEMNLEEDKQEMPEKGQKETGKESRSQKNWLKYKVSTDAMIRRYDKHSYMRMPSDSEYADYTYNVYNSRMKESTILTDVSSDEKERAWEITIDEDEVVVLHNDEEEVELTAKEFIDIVNDSISERYAPKEKTNPTITLPREAMVGMYNHSSKFIMPTNSKYEGYSYYLPNSVVTEDTENEDGKIAARFGDNFKITLRKGEEKIELTAKEFIELCGKTSAEDYKKKPSAIDEYREQQGGEEEKKWKTVALSDDAIIYKYEKSTLLKMPKGKYEGFLFYIPNGMLKEGENGKNLRVPEDFTVHLKDSESGNNIELNAEQFVVAIKDTISEDYKFIRKPSEEKIKQFEKIERNLRANAPQEMLNKPNWVIVRTSENKETGRLDKYLIDIHTGKAARSNDPSTWTDFESACNYAKENGGVALAYALDGTDKIACINLDDCIDKDGHPTELAREVLDKSQSYIERSISGKGLHIFGKTNGMDVRAFSKDGDFEFYQDRHFIAMTGDVVDASKIMDFDNSGVKSIIERKCEKRTEWNGVGAGVEGLSQMDDRTVLERAMNAKNGDTFKRLYNGEDLKNNHSNSDMSLMNQLAFWCSGDKDQMLRIFATSRLYRPDKSQSYYEYTAMKAVKTTPAYIPPKASNNAKKPMNSNGNGKV